MVRLGVTLVILVFLLTSCNPFGQNSFIDFSRITDGGIFTTPFKDTPQKYGDAQAVETVTTDGSTSSTVGYQLQATVQEVSDTQTTVNTTSSTSNYTFTEVYFQ